VSTIDASDRFKAGTWLLDAWMESAKGSTKDRAGGHMTDKVKLTEEQAGWPPATVFFNYFYHGVGKQQGELRFEAGEVDGFYAHPGMDDIGPGTVTIKGTYTPTTFHVRFGQSAFGMAFEQVVEGRLDAAN